MTSHKKWMVGALLILLSAAYFVYRINSDSSTSAEAKIQVASEQRDTLSSKSVNPRNSGIPERNDHESETAVDITTDSNINTLDTSDATAKRLMLPEPGTNATHRVFASVKYGLDEAQLGRKPQGGGEEPMPPQGFAVTAEGRLVVLDTFKQRLVYFDDNGQIEKTFNLADAGFVMPSDVDIAEDGTIAVLDADAGQAPQGLVFFNADGTVKKRMPNIRPASETAGIYAVGDDIYLDNQIWGSEKIATVNGELTETDESNIYIQKENGMTPGWVAPDNTTVVSAGIVQPETGEFFITVIRGKKPDHIFTHFYQKPPPLRAISYAAADAKGNLYAVLYYGDKCFLACFDSAGTPVGQTEMPKHSGVDPGRPFRQYRVLAAGGLLYQVLSDTGSSYEWFDCHP
ncbi:MAG: hypothetical protein JXR76_12740 [Deltaproteobacteria bacterium]|nr:hypothetical protein [Deltaproteobacteria bacterium]